MTQDDVIVVAMQASKEWLKELPTPWETANQVPKRYLEIFANLIAAKATQQEQDRCCAIVFGQCESDNVAQRTVNAIRGKA